MRTGSGSTYGTFHLIYVGLLDTVTTVTIQLFGSHGRFVLIEARRAASETIFVPKSLQSTQTNASDTIQPFDSVHGSIEN